MRVFSLLLFFTLACSTQQPPREPKVRILNTERTEIKRAQFEGHEKTDLTEAKIIVCEAAFDYCDKENKRPELTKPQVGREEKQVLKTGTKSQKQGNNYVVVPDNYYVAEKKVLIKMDFTCVESDENPDEKEQFCEALD